jgi:hypothetical protein
MKKLKKFILYSIFTFTICFLLGLLVRIWYNYPIDINLFCSIGCGLMNGVIFTFTKIYEI